MFVKLILKASENLIEWFLGMITAERKEPHIILKMRQETELPVSGEKLVSNLVFDEKEKVSTDPFEPPAKVKVTFFEREDAKAFVHTIGFDSEGRLHGLVKLSISEDKNYKHNFGFDLHGVVNIQMVSISRNLSILKFQKNLTVLCRNIIVKTVKLFCQFG